LLVNSFAVSNYCRIFATKPKQWDYVAGAAEYIVTNDAHFNVLITIDWSRLTIIALKEFVKQIYV
jgi:hypothetical protein